MADLIFISRGASTAKEGERLTLINAWFENQIFKLILFISHLNQPRFEVRVYKNIKSIQLKTIVPGDRMILKRWLTQFFLTYVLIIIILITKPDDFILMMIIIIITISCFQNK